MGSRIFLMLLFVSTVAPLWGQDSRIDSLQKQLETEASDEEKVKILSRIGMSYHNRQVYFDSAFYYTEKAYLLAKEFDMMEMQARTLFNMGYIYSSINDFHTSIDYYQQAKKVIEELNLQGPLNSVLNNIGGCYFELGEYDRAIDYYKEALLIAKEMGDLQSEGVDYMNIGEALYKKGDLQASKENLEKAKEIIEGVDFDPSSIHLYYGRTMFALQDTALAREEGEKALERALAEKDIANISGSHELLSKIYAAMEDYKSAYNHGKQYRVFNDSINTARELNEIEKLKLNFELQENKEQLNLIIQKTKYQNIIYILACFGVLMLVILVFRQRKIAKMTKEIHNVQKRVVEEELKRREWKRENPDVTSFEVTLSQDEEEDDS